MPQENNTFTDIHTLLLNEEISRNLASAIHERIQLDVADQMFGQITPTLMSSDIWGARSFPNELSIVQPLVVKEEKEEELDYVVGDSIVITDDTILPYSFPRNGKGFAKAIIAAVIEKEGYYDLIVTPEVKTNELNNQGYTQSFTLDYLDDCRTVGRIVSKDTNLIASAGRNLFGVCDCNDQQIKVVERNGTKYKGRDKTDLVLASSLKNFIHANKDNCVICNLLSSKEKMVTNTVNYISINKEGVCTFISSGRKQLKNAEGKWLKDKRQYGSFWRIIRPILQLNKIDTTKVQDKDIEAFTNAVSASFYEGLEFKVSSDVVQAYCMRRIGLGSLGDSCMNDDDAYLELYDSSDNVNILMLIDKDGILNGRALIWDIDHEDLGKIKFLDRFYVARDWMANKFIEFAKENNMFYKRIHNSYSNKNEWIDPRTGSVIYVDASVEVGANLCRFMPYIDTFTYMSEDKKRLYNHVPEQYTYYECASTSGECQECTNDDEIVEYDDNTPWGF